ncbi:MAG: phosphatidylglycerophosphatase A [Candidatus Omnitrophica bacterium]|nr:phosphatidylglycerophosphatase A [Candidatus Omnitrophota bacterium]
MFLITGNKLKKIHRLISTAFGLGYFPVAPGTAGSVAGLALCLLLHKYVFLYIAVFIILFVLGLVSSGKFETEIGIQDASFIVIDEFACIFLVYLGLPINVPLVVAGFLLYRIIDIIKLPPMKSLENLKWGWGIMLDDLVAAIYSNILLHTFIYFHAKLLGQG